MAAILDLPARKSQKSTEARFCICQASGSHLPLCQFRAEELIVASRDPADENLICWLSQRSAFHNLPARVMGLTERLEQHGFSSKFKEFLDHSPAVTMSPTIVSARVDFLTDVIDFKAAPVPMRLAKAHFLWQNYLSEKPNSNPDLPPKLKRRVKRLLWADESGMDPQGLIDETTFGTSAFPALCAICQLITRRPPRLCLDGFSAALCRILPKQ